MPQEPKSLRNDILAPDDIVLLADGRVSTVAQAIHPGGTQLTLNHRLFALRPEEAVNPDAIIEKATKTIARISAGELDSVFIRSNEYQVSQGDHASQHPAELRLRAIDTLSQLSKKSEALNSFVETASKSLASTRELGIPPTDDTSIKALRTFLSTHGELFPEVADRILQSEGVPFLACSLQTMQLMTDKGLSGKPSQRDYARVSFVPTHILGSSSPIKAAQDASVIISMILSDLSTPPCNLISNEDLRKMPGVTFDSVKYHMGRKRDQCERINRNQKKIIISPREGEARAAFLNGALTAPPSLQYDEIGTLGEVHFLLNYYQNDPERSQVRERFETATKFHEEAFSLISRRVEERTQSLQLPPISLPTQHDVEEDASKSPITPEQAIARADRFARSNLPGHYKLRSYLQPTPDHRIALKLTNDAGDTVEKVFTTGITNAEHALDIKRRVQAHLLDIPGIVPYRSPMKEGITHVGLDEFIPAAPPRSRIAPRYGEYRVKLDWREPREEISIPLGLQYSADNHEEALRRAEAVTQQLNQARQATNGHAYLPLTKRDVIDQLRHHVNHQGGRWDERTHGEIEQFPAMLRFPFAKKGHQQDSWLQVEELRTDGDPNYTWILPINIVVNGQRLANASTHVNLHVRDRHAAEERAIETVNRVMQQVAALPRNAQWAIDPERPTHLLELTEAARTAAPHLIDTNRLVDIQNELRSPFQKDLTIQIVGEPVTKDGKVHFALGIVRGHDHHVSEPVLVKSTDNVPPASVQRRFTVAQEHEADIPRFVEAVNRTFRAVIGEEYDPRSASNYDAEQLRKLKAPRPFKPNFAPNVFDRAIETHLPDFAEVTNLDAHVRRARAARPQAGFAGRVNQRGDGPNLPD